MKSIKYIYEFLLPQGYAYKTLCCMQTLCILRINTELVSCVMACEEPPAPSPSLAPAPAQPARQPDEEHLQADTAVKLVLRWIFD